MQTTVNATDQYVSKTVSAQLVAGQPYTLTLIASEIKFSMMNGKGVVYTVQLYADNGQQHPLKEANKGWSSCDNEETNLLYGMTVNKLKIKLFQ